jgi:hypothetical protein
MSTVDRLVPGVTTVTLGARYYALHGLVAAEAKDRDLGLTAAQALLRRCEVVIGAISGKHLQDAADSHAGLSRPHGYDLIHAGLASSGGLDVDALAAPKVYAQAAWGFLPAYRGSEMLLQILSTGNDFGPGARLEESAVRDGLTGLIYLASESKIDPATLTSSSQLCVCGSITSADGAWLAQLLASPGIADPTTRAGVRRGTLQMFLRAVQLADIAQATTDLSRFIAYDERAYSDPRLASLDVTALWRGLMVRNISVTSWREMWAWFVERITGVITRVALIESLADAMPQQTVAEFASDLPATRVAGTERLAPAELDTGIAKLDVPLRSIALLLLGAKRATELSGFALRGFQGDDPEDIHEELAPAWLAVRVSEWANRPLRDFARHLGEIMLARSQRLAYRKARFDPKTSSFKIPSRIHLRDDLVFRDSIEGAGPASLRLNQLASIVAGVGLLKFADGKWRVGPRGDLLD